MTCIKIAYPNRAEAQRAARRVAGQKVYLCSACGQFHLSSKSGRQVKQLRKRGSSG